MMLYVMLLLDMKLLSFAIANLLYSLVLLGAYRYQFRKEFLSKFFKIENLIIKR